MYWRLRWFLGLAAALVAAQIALAADMTEVRRAIAEARYFDAFVDLQELANDGNAEAQFELAGFHHYGRVGPANFEKALIWYTRSADQGNADAMIGLAVLYGHGQGVQRSPETAFRWLATAKRMHLSQETEQRVTGAMDALRGELTSEQLAKAEEAAKAFVPEPE